MFFTRFLSSFLCKGVIFAFFKIFENYLSFNKCSNIIFKGIVIDAPQILIIFIGILPQPWALDEPKVFIINDISSLVTWYEVILAFVLYKNVVKYLYFVLVYLLIKNIIKKISFSQKSETNLPSTNSGGIAETFYVNIVNDLEQSTTS